MSVYVDDMQAQYGHMKMCHMLADTEEDLHAMAGRIGVARRWHQYPGTVKSHYDICMSMREKAVRCGATQIDRRGVAKLLAAKRAALK